MIQNKKEIIMMMNKIFKTTAGILALAALLCCAACGNNNSDGNSSSNASPVISGTSANNADMRFVGTWKSYFKNSEESGMTFGKYEDDLLEIYEDHTGKYLISGEEFPIIWTSNKDTITIKSDKSSTDYVLKDGKLCDPNEDNKLTLGQTVPYYEKQA